MRNQLVAGIFRDIARILEIKGENIFRIRAYERSAQNIESLTEDIRDFIERGRVRQIPGIGKDLEGKIKEIAETGRLKFYEQLKKTIPAGLLEMVNIPSVGPKTARLLYEKLKIKNIPDLEKAIRQGRLTGLFGIKQKTVDNISRGIALLKKSRERLPLAEALAISEEFIAALSKLPQVDRVSTAGSLRRQKDTVRDIDILAVSGRPQKVMDAFTAVASVKEIMAKGATKSSLRTKDGAQVDCRVVGAKSFGAALLYFTGSKNFNIRLRKMAQAKGMKINEYGIFKKGRYLAGKSEQEVFRFLRLPYIEPELREDAGEIELAMENSLPELIELKDIKGDLHVHSDYSDGGNTIREIALAAQKCGYSYVAVTDHSQGLKVAGGLSAEELRGKKREIDRINRSLRGFRVLYGAEVEIDSRGKIDYNDAILKEFDIVVGAIHSGFKQPKEQLTRRIISACENRHVHIIAHPTGRLWGVRDAYELDFDRVLKAARETNTQLEINAFPVRLDLNDFNCRRAKEARVRLSVSTDAHNQEQLAAMRLGVSVARRGWLTKDDVVNTLEAEQLLKTIKK